MKILLIDPNAKRRRLLLRQLEDAGHSVVTTDSTEKAESYMRHWKPDVLVSADEKITGTDIYEDTKAVNEPFVQEPPSVTITALCPESKRTSGRQIDDPSVYLKTLFESGILKDPDGRKRHN